MRTIKSETKRVYEVVYKGSVCFSGSAEDARTEYNSFLNRVDDADQLDLVEVITTVTHNLLK